MPDELILATMNPDTRVGWIDSPIGQVAVIRFEISDEEWEEGHMHIALSRQMLKDLLDGFDLVDWGMDEGFYTGENPPTTEQSGHHQGPAEDG
jgi:hypothetical protein